MSRSIHRVYLRLSSLVFVRTMIGGLLFWGLTASGCGESNKANEQPKTNKTAGKETSSEKTEFISHSFPAMGTVFTFRVEDRGTRSKHALRLAFDEVARLETVLSEWRDDSEISKINQHAGVEAIAVGEDTWKVVKAGLDISRWSDGAFDLSWAALAGVYDFRPGKWKVPPRTIVKKKLALINHQDIEVDEEAHTVFLKRKGMAIGTGGIAKGYALDRAAMILREAGLHHFMLIGGGQVQVHGKPGPRPWRIGIQHPRENGYFASLEVKDGSISTSGDYEHGFIDKKGKRWHHILDPRSGLPSKNTIAVTVISESGLYSDALSTAAFVLGPEGAKKMLKNVPVRFEAIFVDNKCQVVPLALKDAALIREEKAATLRGCTK